jgi:flotillin
LKKSTLIEINSRKYFKNVDSELKKIGLKLINVNVTDIKDESGYIEALGKEAAAKAINENFISVAEQEKLEKQESNGCEKDVQIAETHRDRDKNAITNKDREVSIAAALKMKVLVKGSSKRYSCKNI